MAAAFTVTIAKEVVSIPGKRKIGVTTRVDSLARSPISCTAHKQTAADLAAYCNS